MSPETKILVVIGFLAAVFGACMGAFLYRRARRAGRKEAAAEDRYRLTTIFAAAAAAAAYVSVFLKCGLSSDTLKYLWFMTLLLAVSFRDIESFEIPDGWLIFGIIGWGIFLFTGGNVKNSLFDSLIGGAALAGALLAVVLIAEKILKKEAMGGGDIKLLFVTGLYLGWKGNFFCLVAACIFGIIVGLVQLKKNEGESKAFPWGPSIAAGAWLAVIVGNDLMNWYISLL